MNLIDKVILEWSWRCKKGYPDITNPEDLSILKEVFGITLEAYTLFPKSVDEIDNPKVKDLFNIVKGYPNLKIEDPITIDPGKKNQPKITRSLQRDQNFISYLSEKLGVEIEDTTAPIKWNGLTIAFGEGSRGGRGAQSKGFAFEDEIASDLTKYKNGETDFTHEELTKLIIKDFKLTPDNFEVIPEGAENKKRPLVFTPDGPIIGYSEDSVAATLTDLTIRKTDGTVYYLSLKFGGTLTFFNAGVGRIFQPEDFQDGKIDNTEGQALLETFGINNEIFCRVFNEYKDDGTGTDFSEYNGPTKKYDAAKLYNLVSSGIGDGYYMLKAGGGVEFFYVGEEYNRKASAPIGGIIIEYGGATGKGKRVDVRFESETYKFKINIRNKQGRLYPSHIMCDYKKK